MDNKEPKRFTSKAEITPMNPFEEHIANQQTPHEPASNNKSQPSTVRHIPITTESPFGSAQRVASPSRFSNSRATPTSEYYQSPRSGRKVHYIPIYVEGSEKPVMPKNVEEPVEQRSFSGSAEQRSFPGSAEQRSFPGSAEQRSFPGSAEQRSFPGSAEQRSFPGSAEQRSFASTESAPSKRPSDACSFGSSVPTPGSAASSRSTPFSQHEREVPVQVETPASPPPPPQPTPPAKPDPLKQVQDVQQEVDSLTQRVEQFSGASRTDKEYLYLDEMLTRELIKLDIIEVAGNEELRVARKNVIRCIQQAIALLESKVPLKEGNQGSMPDKTEPESVEANGDDAVQSSNATASSEMPAQTEATAANGEKTN